MYKRQLEDKQLTKLTISGIDIKTTKKCNAGDKATITVSVSYTHLTCRSPMAEAIANAVFKNNGMDACAFSRGIFAESGMPASEYAKLAVKNYGLSLEKHRACQLTESDIKMCIRDRSTYRSYS